MNYQIIRDEALLREFIDWLPDLQPQEQYYLTLLGRAKYYKEGNLQGDKNQLKRVTTTKERMIEKIRQMESAVGSYTFKGEPIPQKALALYISSNPRDFHKASFNLLKELATKLSNSETTFNPHTLALSTIQVSGSRKIHYDIDVDFKSEYNPLIRVGPYEIFKEQIEQLINKDCLTLIRTRGGVHCLVALDKIDPKIKNNWYQRISKMGNDHYEITMNGCDNLLPVVGATQGEFVPYFGDSF